MNSKGARLDDRALLFVIKFIGAATGCVIENLDSQRLKYVSAPMDGK